MPRPRALVVALATLVLLAAPAAAQTWSGAADGQDGTLSFRQCRVASAPQWQACEIGVSWQDDALQVQAGEATVNCGADGLREFAAAVSRIGGMAVTKDAPASESKQCANGRVTFTRRDVDGRPRNMLTIVFEAEATVGMDDGRQTTSIALSPAETAAFVRAWRDASPRS